MIATAALSATVLPNDGPTEVEFGVPFSPKRWLSAPSTVPGWPGAPIAGR